MTRSPFRRGSSEEIAPKPYELIPFPKTPPFLTKPDGHHRYRHDRQHGILSLSLSVQTPLHVSTGVIAMGSDVRQSVPLIKTMTETDDALVIQGSSLKGCVRAIYETITNSTLAVVTPRYRRDMPPERLPCNKKEKLCPASRVFGALDWQGLVSFSDARCLQTNSTVGFMPSMYRPRPERKGYYDGSRVVGRKFYYHARRAVEGSKDRGVPVQQAARNYKFSTAIHYMNLQNPELGALLIALGQDVNHPFALKIGGGKPIGMGTMTISIDKIEQVKDMRDRYLSYEVMPEVLTGQSLQAFIQETITQAHNRLIEAQQLQQLAEVLRYPTDRDAPSGMY